MIIGRTYKLTEKVNSGSFGEIWRGINMKTNHEVAIKLEKTEYPYKIKLFHEFKIYQILLKESGFLVMEKGIPNVYCCDEQAELSYLVMDLLGPNLEDLFIKCNMKFTLKTVLMLASQMITRIEYLHSKGYVHRDIKPGNFVIGTGEKSHIIYLIDFGLAKHYIQKDGKHIPYQDGVKFSGTARYGSISHHFGILPTRRDDLEALGYALLYFLRGSLPWQNLKSNEEHSKIQLVRAKKYTTIIEDLCEGSPSEFVTYLYYVRRLLFDEKPNYDYLRKLFEDLLIKSGFKFDYLYDWVLPEDNKKKKGEKKEFELSTNQNLPNPHDNDEVPLCQGLQNEIKEDEKN